MFVGNPLGSISGDAKGFVGQCDVCGINGVNNALVVEGFSLSQISNIYPIAYSIL